MKDFARYFTTGLALALLAWGCENETPVSPDGGESSGLEAENPPVVNDNLIHIVTGPGNWVVDENGNEVTDPEALLWFRDPFIAPLPDPEPLLAPDGSQVTLGEFTAAEGRVRVKCVGEDMLLDAHFSGLLPNGVYTLWLALLNPPFDGTFANLFAVGAAGPQDGSQNGFRASASGEGQVSLMISEGPLTFIPGEIQDGCLFDDPTIAQWFIVGAYHTDGQTHGGDPGPRIEPFLFIFDN